MEELAKLFGSESRVKLMRLFLLNPTQGFDLRDMVERSRVSKSNARRELNLLKNATLIVPTSFIKTEPGKKGKPEKKRRVNGFTLNQKFKYLRELRAILVDAEFLTQKDILRRFKGVGRIKLFFVSGIFIQDPSSRVDFLLVGDNLKKQLIDKTIKSLEAEIGKQLSYAVFDTNEFTYRLSMYDKLIRDILDYPHERLIDTKGLTEIAGKGQFTSKVQVFSDGE